jgi:tyrosine-protein phosphatase SIW14
MTDILGGVQQAILTPPEAFAQVEPDLYRAKQILPPHFEYLKRLKLRTLVKLTSEAPFKAVVSFCDENNVQLVHLGARKWKADTSWKPITEELVKEALEIVLDRTRHPVLLMCSSGMSQTAVVVACLRRLQHWNMTSILVEMSLGQNSKFSNEQFVELFDTDLVTLPKQLPDWFVAQESMWLAEKAELLNATSSKVSSSSSSSNTDTGTGAAAPATQVAAVDDGDAE